MADKTKCAISKDEFKTHAQPLQLKVNGQTLVADPKEFSTGSFGWYFSGKITVEIDGKPVQVQAGLNLTVVGSKPQQ